MWIVAKIKPKELNTFQKNLLDKIGEEIKFYYPKIQYDRYFKGKTKKIEKSIIENYIFCFNQKFNENGYINKIKFVKGLEYFLSGNDQNQKEIENFIENCKKHENKEGYLTQDFFKKIITNKAKFLSGPFTNMIFKILERKKNTLRILIGNTVTTISDKTNYLYRPV